MAAAIANRIGGCRRVQVGDGQSGAATYRITGGPGDLYLKCGEGIAPGRVRDEAARLRWAAGRMLLPRVVEAVEQGDAAWLLTEALPGLPAGAWIKCNGGRAPEAAAGMSDFPDSPPRLAGG